VPKLGPLVISEVFLPTEGGTAVWAGEVYKRMGGKEIHIVAAKVPGAERIDAVHPNTVHRVNLYRVPWIRPESLLMYLRVFARSFRLAITHRFVAIHAFRALPEGLVGWVIARLTLRPLATYAHGEELTTTGSGAKFKVMRFVLRHSDHVIANSEHTRHTLLDIGVTAERVALIHPGVNLDRFRPDLDSTGLRESIGITGNEKLVLSVGRLTRRKGFDCLIDAVTELRRRGRAVSLAIAGIGEDRERLRSLIALCDAQRYVHVLGAVEDAELPSWLNASDVFAMCNRDIDGDNEGFGIVFIEAAACGKPALAGLAGGAGSAVVDGLTGYRVDGRDVAMIAQSLERLLFDPSLAKTMGETGRRRACAEFSWTLVAERTRRLHDHAG
jgi:phosphatidylinositol alpha-1,6-mannosyltransferase